LARSLFELEDYKGAFQVLDKLQPADPKNPDVLYTLGLVHMKLAETTLGELQKVAPGSYLIEVLLGKYAEVKQVYPDAIEHYKRALAKNPESLGLHYTLAHALWASGRFQDALPEYKRALELNPYDYDGSWEMARIVLPDNPAEAYRLANRALELKPGIPEALAIRGRALLALKKPKEAIEDLRKASALDTEDATIHFQLARAYRQLGLTQEAEAETAVYERMEKEAHTPRGEQPVTPR
jgi:tetratricopeptide (TPR) repeat protein